MSGEAATGTGVEGEAYAERSLALRRGFFGVEGLDDLVPEGVTYDTQIMVQGDTGIGKSVLAAQFVYEGLLAGDVCIYIACDEPPEAMRRSMANFRLGTRAYEETGQLVFVDAYTRERSRERHHIVDPGNFDEFFLYQRRLVEGCRGRPTRLVVDSMSTILSTADTTDTLQFSGARLRYLRSAAALTLDNYVLGVMDERSVAGLSHVYPLIVNMKYVPVAGALQRYIQLGKLRSGQFSATQHPFTIDARTGIVITGRREAL